MKIMQEIFSFNLADWVILSVIVVSTLISLARGFLKEFISLFVWILGFWVAMQFYHVIALVLAQYISSPGLRQLISFAGIFIIVLILGSLFSYFLSFLINKSGLSGTDRILGMLFGCARGVLLVAVTLLLISSTAFVQDEWWLKSVLIPHFQVVVDWLRVFLPEKIISVANVVR